VSAAPAPGQIAAARSVTAWYLSAYYLRPEDMGMAPMFCDPGRVGAFAVPAEDLAAGRPRALFRLLSAVVMFQRRQDKQITAILRGISPADADELSDPSALLRLAEASGCDLATSLASLKTMCDLTKDAEKRGVCTARPGIACAPKRHTVLMRRYGHFGKVPTSLALAVREAGASDLEDLYRSAVRGRTPVEAAAALESALTGAWRVSDKISAMYLSMLTNPQLSAIPAPWADGVDCTRFVAIDSNVDLFLAAIGYRGAKTYDARRRFIQAMAAEIDLSELRAGLRPYDPRLVQQAMFMFMSVSNRRATGGDCSQGRPSSCLSCPRDTAQICPLRGSADIQPEFDQ
jgi:hypothetical protein